MIPGLPVDELVERRIWSAFENWAGHARCRLTSTGIDGLFSEYEAVIQSAESRTCFHGADGARLVGDDWQACCGISYEYLNDIGVRDAIETIIQLIPMDIATALRSRLTPLDRRLRTLIDDPPPTGLAWWYTLPRTVEP